MTVHSLSEEIQALADKLGITAAEVSRSKFRKETGHSGGTGTQWGEAKALACGDRVPLPAIPDGHTVKGVSTLVDAEGRTRGQWVKTRAIHLDPVATLERVSSRLQGLLPPAPVIRKPRKPPTGRLAVTPMGDPHLAMYARARETGQEDWDLRKAVDIHKEAIDFLCTEGASADEALLINLGDFFHADGPGNTTTKGTPVDVDGFWWEALEAGVEMMDHMVHRLLENHGTVTVWNMQGNHDRHSALALAVMLRDRFRDNPRVDIPLLQEAFAYLRFGECLIGAHHGDTVKNPKDLALRMANDVPRMVEPSAWGECWARHLFLGHVHHASGKEEGGVYIQTMRTLAPRDGWHALGPWVALRDMRRLIFDYQDGLVREEGVPARLLARRMVARGL